MDISKLFKLTSAQRAKVVQIEDRKATMRIESEEDANTGSKCSKYHRTDLLPRIAN